MPIQSYSNFEEKSRLFELDSSYPDNKISDIDSFNKWYDNFLEGSVYSSNNFNYFFRGMNEAKFKLYNTAQREWISNNMQSWKPNYSYLQFIKDMIDEAKKKPLFKNVLDYYQIDYYNEADFPILSILQHYGSLSPLMDWTYNLDVALYFATENVSATAASDSIDGYFSVYMISKTENENLKNIFDYSYPAFPGLDKFRNEKFGETDSINFACYISDFEENNQTVKVNDSRVPAKDALQKSRPLTTYYNQNIIPQQGLFIFNPSPVKPLEEIFNSGSPTKRVGMGNLTLAPFFCYNIRKDLADYIRRKISKPGHDITTAFIYPELRLFLKQVKENVFNNCLSAF